MMDSNTTEIIKWILSGVATVICSLVLILWKRQEKEVDDVNKKCMNIEKNYINRFDENNKDHTEIKIVLSRQETKLDMVLEMIKELKNDK